MNGKTSRSTRPLAAALLCLALAPLADGQREPAAPLSSQAQIELARAGENEPLLIELHVQPVRSAAASEPTATATFAVDERGSARYTLNGRPVSHDELAAHAAIRKADLAAHGRELARADQARLDGVLARAGLVGHVVARDGLTARLRLTRSELEGALPAIGGEASLIDVPREVTNTLTNATSQDGLGGLEAINVRPFAHSYGLKGSGIGVWLQEGNSPDESNAAVNAAKLRFLTNEGPGEHATLTTVTLQKTAPEATVYYGNQPLGCHLMPSIVWQTSPPIYLGSHSWNWGDTTTSAYTTCSAEWDDFVFDYRLPMFVPSGGNELGSYVTTPGKAFNVMTIGGANEDFTGVSTWFSGYLNPETGAMKPDVVTPGTCIAIMDGFPCVNGVSIATPIGAGFAADMLGGSAFFRNQPQAVKAYMVAGATTDLVTGSTTIDGAGMVDFLNTYYNRSGKWWNGGNSAYFNANDEIFEAANLVVGKRYRIAISWLVRGSYALANKKPSMEMTLTVSRTGMTPITSAVSRSIVQWVDFVAPASGSYSIKIKRTVNEGNHPLALALTVGEVL